MDLKETQKFWELETQVKKKTKPYLLLQKLKALTKNMNLKPQKNHPWSPKIDHVQNQKTMNIGTTKSINNEVQKSRCLERYTPQSVWTKKT